MGGALGLVVRDREHADVTQHSEHHSEEAEGVSKVTERSSHPSAARCSPGTPLTPAGDSHPSSGRPPSSGLPRITPTCRASQPRGAEHLPAEPRPRELTLHRRRPWSHTTSSRKPPRTSPSSRHSQPPATACDELLLAQMWARLHAAVFPSAQSSPQPRSGKESCSASSRSSRHTNPLLSASFAPSTCPRCLRASVPPLCNSPR